MDRIKLERQLNIDEDRKNKPYRDTRGNLTTGVGRNLDAIPFSDDEIDLMLKNDINRAVARLDLSLPWWRNMTEARQNVLANMSFNLGGKLLTFKKALAAMERNDYEAAAREMENSSWFHQVGDRAVRLIAIMRHG